MQSVKPVMKQSACKKFNQEYVCDDENCQYTKSAKSVCDDKNCQSNQCFHMWPVKSPMKSHHMQSVRPTKLQSRKKKYSYEVCQVRPVCNDKNCQSAKSMCYDKKCQVKSQGKQSSLQSMSKTACKQIWTQPEVTRNSVHIVLPKHDHFVHQQAMCKHSTSKSCYPPETTHVSPLSWITRYILTIVILEVPRCNLHNWGQWTQGRCNPAICSQWKLSSRSHKSTQDHKYRQANIIGTLRPKLDL